MSSSSESEGEIVEAKATTAQHHANCTSVNTPTRTTSASKSPALALDGVYERDRSRSSSRHPSPRGEKRNHDDYRPSSRRDDYGRDEYQGRDDYGYSRRGSYGRDDYSTSHRDQYSRGVYNDSYPSSHRRDESGRDEFGRDESRRPAYQHPYRASYRDYGHQETRRDTDRRDDRRSGGRARRREYYDYDDPGHSSYSIRGGEDRRYRSRSRSPKRSRTENYRERSHTPVHRGQQVLQGQRPREAYRDDRDDKRQAEDYSVSDWGNSPTNIRDAQIQTKPSSQTSYQISQLQAIVAEEDESVPTSASHESPSANYPPRVNAMFNIERGLPTQAELDEMEKSNVAPVAAPEPVDEDALIEQRRKRREEIKAKYAAEAASTVQEPTLETQSPGDVPPPSDVTQAPPAMSETNLMIETDSTSIRYATSRPSNVSPTALQRGYVSPTTSQSPRSPKEATIPSFDGTGQHVRSNTSLPSPNCPSVSPFTSPKTPLNGPAVESWARIVVQNDEEPANGSIAATGQPETPEEPLAADYNPEADIQDKLREMQRYQEKVTTRDRNGTETGTKQVKAHGNVEQSLPNQKPQKQNTDIDMFAEEDDDDMFAPETDDQASKDVVRAPKELEANMLDNWDTPGGYYIFIKDELLDKRYHVMATIGEGVFANVARAVDNKTGKYVAIKAIRNNQSMKRAAVKEISVLTVLKEKDPDDRKHVVRLERSFEHKGHLCVVFEHLSMDLRAVLKKNGSASGLDISAVRVWAHQMFLSLLLFKEANILHADLKPDNMLVNESNKLLKICDLGSAVDISDVYANDPHPYLASRFYRAPELILCMKYGFAIDMWSIGCTLFELFTGRILFSGDDNNGMLGSMMKCRGRFPPKVLKRAVEAHYATGFQYAFPFNNKLDEFYEKTKDKSGKEVGKWISIAKFPEHDRDLKSRIFKDIDEKSITIAERNNLSLFVDLLEKCLQLNPDKRITPEQALQHPFFFKSRGPTRKR